MPNMGVYTAGKKKDSKNIAVPSPGVGLDLEWNRFGVSFPKFRTTV
jgi:hypothetical protein